MKGDREYVRERVSKGEATKWEKHWLWCVDKNGAWAPPHKGPYAREFDGAWVAPEEVKHVAAVDVAKPPAAAIPSIEDDDGIY